MPLSDPFDNTAPSAIAMPWSAKVVATANIVIATALVPGQVIDGYTLLSGDVVLCVGQATGSQNGLYISAAAPLRHPLFSDNTEVGAGIAVQILAGSVGAGKEYELVTPPPIIVGTTALTFAVATVTGIILPATVGQTFDNTAPVAGSVGGSFDNTAPVASSVGGSFDNTAPAGVFDYPAPNIVPFSVHTASRTNVNIGVTLNGQTIAGQLLDIGHFILLLGQTLPAANGVYIVNAGVPTRHTALNSNAELNESAAAPFGGVVVNVDRVGNTSTENGKQFILVTQPPIAIDVTALSFQEKSAIAKTV